MSILRTHFFVRATFVVALFFACIFIIFSVDDVDAATYSLDEFTAPTDYDPNSNPLTPQSVWNIEPEGYVPLGNRTPEEISTLSRSLTDSELSSVGLSTDEIAAVRAAEEAASEAEAAAKRAAAIAAAKEEGLASANLTIYNVLIRFGGWVAGLGGTVFDKSFELFVTELGCMFVQCNENSNVDSSFNGEIGGVVNIIWTIIRDLFNILFIFALVYIGLRLILLSDDSRTKKDIGNLIIAALLINFSLFIAKLVVDITNFTAATIYTSMTKKMSVQFATQSFELNSGESIAGAFMGILKIVTFFRDGSGTNAPGAEIFFSMIAMFFLCFLGIVFLYGAFMMLARFIGIVILLILSPAMFLGMILPNFASQSTKWRKMFLAYCFYAPAFVFMIYVSLFSLSQLATVLGDGTYSGAIAPDRIEAGSFDIYLLLFVGFGFLYASFKVADMMSDAGAGATMKFAHNIGRAATYGAAGSAVYRNTFGRGADLIRRGIDATDAAARDDSRSRSSRLTAAAARTGLSLTGGGSARVARRQMTQVRDASVAGGASFTDVEKDSTERRQRGGRSNAINSIRTAVRNYESADPTNREDERIAMERAIKDASPAQITDMAKNASDRQLLQLVAGDLTDSQIKGLVDDKDIDESITGPILGARAQQVESRLIEDHGSPGDTIEKVIGKADASQLKALNPDTVLNNAGHLTAKQIEDWKDLTVTEKKRLKDRRKKDLEDLFATPGGAAAVFDRFKNDTERAKLPKLIITAPAAVLYLNKNVLTKMVDIDGIEDTDRATIKRNITARFPVGTPDGDAWNEWFTKNNAGQRFP